MSKVYELDLNAVEFLFGYVSSQNFAGLQLSPTARFQAKKFLTICKQLPAYGEKHGYVYFGADFSAPMGDPVADGDKPANRPIYYYTKDADGQAITTCRIKLPQAIVEELLWEHCIKRNLEGNVSMVLADWMERWVKDLGLQETYDKWAESILPEDEDEDEPKAEAEAPVPQEA